MGWKSARRAESQKHWGKIMETTEPFKIGDEVVIRCHDEGFSGKTGTVIAVFPSGRCQVAVGPINVLNLPPEALRLQ